VVALTAGELEALQAAVTEALHGMRTPAPERRGRRR